jgi:sec-independent protein translocase protein TatA
MLGLDNPVHILFLLVVLLLLFGAKRLPEMGRGLGAGMRDFKDALSGQSKAEPEETTDPAPAQLVAQASAVPPSETTSPELTTVK